MKIHVWGINYSPEVTGIGPFNLALCDFLNDRGHSVRMVTSFCYYPSWQKLPSEEGTLFRTDTMDGIRVHRCWHYVPKRVTTLRRVFHELSFVATSFLRQIFLPRPDLLVVISPPLLLGAAAWLLSILKRTSFVFHVQDLQPDAAANLGMLEGQSSILSALRKLEQFAYEKASRVSAITPGMLRNISAKGIPSTKLILFPNGVELPEFWRLPDKNQFRKLHGFSEADFLVTYSGNLGRKQGLDQLLQVAALTREPRIRFVICGDGAERDQLQAAAAELRLQNLTFLPLQPEVRYRELLVDTDISVVPQQSHGGSCFFPSKLLKILAFSSPVLALTDPGTELDRAVAEGGFGVRFRPDEPGEIADFLERLSHNPDSLKDWGREGFKFVKRFEQAAVLLAYTGELEQFEPGSSAASREAGCCADKQTSPESAALQNHPAIPPA